MDVYRGDIFFVKGNKEIEGSEQKQNRPCVVVSNNIGNEHAPIVEVVFLTSMEKARYLPTHCNVKCMIESTALCEQVTTISKSRLGDYIRTCTPEEMKEIDKCLMVSLGITLENKSLDQSGKINALENEINFLKKENEELNNYINCLKKENEELKTIKATSKDENEVVILKGKLQAYMEQNEKLLEKLIG